MNVPVMADDNYIAQMATLVHNKLGTAQKIYVELSNEVWNLSFGQSKYAISQGKALWPTRSSGKKNTSTAGNGSECAPHKCAISGGRSGVPTRGSYVCSARRRPGASRRPKR